MVLDREAILTELKLKTERVPFGSGEVIVRELDAPGYMDAYQNPLAKGEGEGVDGEKFTALLATRCIVDEEGVRIFTDEDAELLRAGASSRYSKLVGAVNCINGLTTDPAKN